jgi:hypothetical protein
MRPGNRNEEFYRYMAQELAEPALCRKISWSAMVAGGFFIEPSYARSDCYDFIAGRTRRPGLCWQVKRLGAFHLLSEQTSVWSCLGRAIHGWNGGIAVSNANLIEFFGQMGYPRDSFSGIGAQRYLDEVSGPSDSLNRVARQRLIDRVMRLPDFDPRGQPSSRPSGDSTRARNASAHEAVPQ